MSGVPLYGEPGGTSGSSGTDQFNTTATPSGAAGGPSFSVSTASGSEFTVDGQDLLVYAAVIQTILLAYVTYKEVSA